MYIKVFICFLKKKKKKKRFSFDWWLNICKEVQRGSHNELKYITKISLLVKKRSIHNHTPLKTKLPGFFFCSNDVK